MIWAFKNVTYASTCKGWAKKRVMPAKKFTEAWTYSSSRKIQAAQFAVVIIAVANFVVHIFQASKISFGIWYLVENNVNRQAIPNNFLPHASWAASSYQSCQHELARISITISHRTIVIFKCRVSEGHQERGVEECVVWQKLLRSEKVLFLASISGNTQEFLSAS